MSVFTVKTDAISEFVEKKSRFIGHIFFVTSEEEAMAKVREIKEKHADATHNCWAYSLRKFSARRFSDDGEPQGTAGMPILSAIDNNNLVDCVVIVTRYFGGTLLGAGGLVRAYTHSAVLAIEEAGKAEIVPFITFLCDLDYDRLQRFKQVLSKNTSKILSEDYGERVTIKIEMAKDEFSVFERNIRSYFYDLELSVLAEVSGRR